jgi:hypothetical protein
LAALCAAFLFLKRENDIARVTQFAAARKYPTTMLGVRGGNDRRTGRVQACRTSWLHTVFTIVKQICHKCIRFQKKPGAPGVVRFVLPIVRSLTSARVARDTPPTEHAR